MAQAWPGLPGSEQARGTALEEPHCKKGAEAPELASQQGPPQEMPFYSWCSSLFTHLAIATHSPRYPHPQAYAHVHKFCFLFF